LARQARAAGNHPFGALLVLDGDVIVSAQNTVFTDRDPTAHAETNLLAARHTRSHARSIRGSVLYTSCEPCAMCVGKMYLGRNSLVVYALAAEELAKLAGGSFCDPVQRIVRASRRSGRGDRPAVAGRGT
jgi:tRNA(Arg) A34 adenosine deaminase TadA